MKIAIIGRTELLYETVLQLKKAGHEIGCILTAKEAPEYSKTADDFRELATSLKIPFAQGSQAKDYIKFLKNVNADIGISTNYTGIIPQTVIDLFPLGILNAHGGDLPRYRGNACQAWAILNGETRIGLCIHRMIGGELDSGDIIARDYLPIDHTTKVTQVWQWMASRAPHLMLEAVQQLGNDPKYILEKQSKDPALALRCYPRRPEDARIDWNKSAIDVLRLINACNKPYAGAFCFYEKTKAIIWDAEIEEDKAKFCAVPGQILRFDETTALVACKIGSIRIKHLEMNKKSIRPHQIKMTTRKRFS